MKVIKIKNFATEKLHTLPDNFSTFVEGIDGSQYVAHIFEMTDGTFGGILVNIGYQDQINLNDDFIGYLKDIDSDAVGYVKQLWNPEVTNSISFYKRVTSKVEKDIEAFLKSESSVFDYSLAQPFNDNPTLAVQVKDFLYQNAKELTYYQRLSTYLKCWFDAMAGDSDYENATSLWAGNAFSNLYSSEMYLVDGSNAAFTTREQLVEFLNETGSANDDKQCNDLREKFYNTGEAENAEEQLKTIATEAKVTLESAEEEKNNATKALDEAEDAYDNALDALGEAQEAQTKAQEAYDKCAAEDPPCEEEKELADELQTANEDVVAREEDVKQKNAELSKAEDALEQATELFEAATAAEAKAQANLAHQIAAIACGQCYDPKWRYAKCESGACENAPEFITSTNIQEENGNTAVKFQNLPGAEPEWECCYTFSEIIYDSEPADNNPFSGIFTAAEGESPCELAECGVAEEEEGGVA